MPSSQLFIPPKIKVGYQDRADTYTKRLAYVIYYDMKGVLRKETSWRGWIDKGVPEGTKRGRYNDKGVWGVYDLEVRDALPIHDFDNVPMEGFVLNKKAGGYSTGWNHRQTYCRVYDPRGFEFEIAIDNLLFILQECTSSKGKGLEGEFVYAWEGKNLVLLPAHCEEYTNSVKFTGLKKQTVKAKELILGATYETKAQESLIYLGKFDWYTINQLKISPEERRNGRYDYKSETTLSKPYFFMNGDKLVVLTALTSLANCKEETPVSNYAELMQEFSKNKNLSKPIGIELVKLPEINFKEETHDETKGNYSNYFNEDLFLKKEDKIIKYSFSKQFKNEWTPATEVGKSSTHKSIFLGYHLIPSKIIKFENDKIILKDVGYDSDYHFYKNKGMLNYGSKENLMFTKEEIMNGQFQNLIVKLEDGREINFNEFYKN